MNLNSFSFLIFLGIILACMVVLQLFRKKAPISGRLQLLLLLAASYGFIFFFDWRFCLCIAAVTVIAYGAGLLYARFCSKKILITGIVLLILFLGFFKHINFFINGFSAISGLDTITVNIILPIGVSFYVLSALSYLIDLYRGEYPAEKNFLDFALYVSFFPKLTAGPIVRGRDFFSQIKDYRGMKWDAFQAGMQMFVFGLFKKIVLADHLGVFVDDVFHAPTAYCTGTVILAGISYSLQIYFDFSGYSDMAIGVSKILGFDFQPNFNLPYIARSASEFWRRWHISLSSWFRDYLYIPLGGNRKGAVQTCVNLLIVMLVSGLWHGAGWTFVVWGALHGIVCCIDRVFGKKLKRLGGFLNWLLTFTTVTLFWVVFRAGSIPEAMKVWTGMFTVHTGISQPYTWSFFAAACLIAGTFFAYRKSKKEGKTDRNGQLWVDGYYPILDLSTFRSWFVFFLFCGLTVIMGYFGNTVFIYGAF